MNDRLKFRAWIEDVGLEDKNGNEYKKSFMIYGIAVFGGCRVGHYKEYLERQLELQGFSEDEIEQFEDEWCLEEGGDWFNFDADEIEQYTGLKDKNGKLIYEGDIVRQSPYNDYFEYADFVISWEEGSFSNRRCLTMKSKSGEIIDWSDNCYCFSYYICQKFADRCEVIGNIHENPELME